MNVNIHQAKTHLSRLLEKVAEGEEVVIMRSNKPVAKLIAVSSPVRKRDLGWARGEFTVPDDFDQPLPPDIEDAFYR